mmetsp:Transcript_50603/g.119872  ORF Transcript_50603/g.119872 Transcript_50603/m.119872 type:complete len:264 (+) Transcript_50603:139-930(+)
MDVGLASLGLGLGVGDEAEAEADEEREKAEDEGRGPEEEGREAVLVLRRARRLRRDLLAPLPAAQPDRPVRRAPRGAILRRRVRAHAQPVSELLVRRRSPPEPRHLCPHDGGNQASETPQHDGEAQVLQERLDVAVAVSDAVEGEAEAAHANHVGEQRSVRVVLEGETHGHHHSRHPEREHGILERKQPASHADRTSLPERNVEAVQQEENNESGQGEVVCELLSLNERLKRSRPEPNLGEHHEEQTQKWEVPQAEHHHFEER